MRTQKSIHQFENPEIYSCAILIPLKLVYRCTFEAFCRFKGIKITDRILSVVNDLRACLSYSVEKL